MSSESGDLDAYCAWTCCHWKVSLHACTGPDHMPCNGVHHSHTPASAASDEFPLSAESSHQPHASSLAEDESSSLLLNGNPASGLAKDVTIELSELGSYSLAKRKGSGRSSKDGPRRDSLEARRSSSNPQVCRLHDAHTRLGLALCDALAPLPAWHVEGRQQLCI